MRIVHICLNGPYTENWGYQENIVPKFHAQLGHQVTVLAQTYEHAETGEIVAVPPTDYVNRNGVRVIRIEKKRRILKKWESLFPHTNIYSLLKSIHPEFIMVHGLIGDFSSLQVRKYIRRDNPSCVCVADVHEDAFVSPRVKNFLKRWILRSIKRYANALMYPYYSKIYYVGPNCGEYARIYYKAPIDKLELLPLGYDPELTDDVDRYEVRKRIRTKLGIEMDSVVLVHGGKLDEKKATVELIRATKLLRENGMSVSLIIFGSVFSSYKREFEEAIEGTERYIWYTGRLSQEEYYDLYFASDIAVFPGTESALWLEAIGCGLPLVIKDFKGQFLDVGGNVRFLDIGSVDEIVSVLSGILVEKTVESMKRTALEKGREHFSYRQIAQKILAISQSERTYL